MRNSLFCKALSLILVTVILISTIAVGAQAAGPLINVRSTDAIPGETVEVEIYMENTPGIVNLILHVDYDNSVFTLKKVIDGGILGSQMHTPNYSLCPYQLTWANDTAPKNFTENGKLVTLVFEVSEDAVYGDYDIGLSYDYDNWEIVNFDFERVRFDVMSGIIKVKHDHILVTDPAVEATCTKTGKTEGSHCSVCGEVIKAQTTVAKKAHSYKNVVTKADATNKKNGKITPTCSVCGDKSTTSIAYPKTVTLAYTEKTYTGKALKPAVTVMDSKGNKIASSNYTVSYKSNTNVGKATVTVTFKGNYKGTITKTFRINPKGTTLSKLTAKSKGFTATWKKQATQTTGYEIQYSTSSKFTDKTTKTIKVTSAKTVTKAISKLKAGTKYYVRIRTYKTVSKTNYYSAWSKSLAVTTKK